MGLGLSTPLTPLSRGGHGLALSRPAVLHMGRTDNLTGLSRREAERYGMGQDPVVQNGSRHVSDKQPQRRVQCEAEG